MEVYVNNPSCTKVRIVAVPENEEIACRRRAKAKKDASGHKPSKNVLDLMSWTIFITTIPKECATFKQIHKMYSLRWRIEIIFKAWKSHVKFAKCHNVSEYQLRTLLIARLIMIVIYVHCVYSPCFNMIREEYGRDLSLLRIFNYLTLNIGELWIMIALALNMAQNSIHSEKAKTNIVKYCSYDKRTRTNFIQLIMNDIELS